jgi:four helix bundle protein
MAGVSRYEDLDSWRLCVELRDRIFKLTESGAVARNFTFRDQIRDSSSSPPRNIAEGFGRFAPRQFAQFVRIARGSLKETKSHIQDGRAKRYVTDEQANELIQLAHRCLGAVTNFMRYLETCGDMPNGWQKPQRRKRRRSRGRT